MPNKNRSTTLAIDFGTSHSLVGAFHQGQIIPSIAIDPTYADPSLMRTLLYFPETESCLFGHEALKKYLENDMSGRLFRSFKSHLPNKNYLGTIINNRSMTLENMIGLFLLELKTRSESYLKTEIKKTIIGKPARYSMDPNQDQLAMERMRNAANFAGFTEVHFMPEPLAAALEFRKEIQKEKIILIGDFGGGTSDFTIMKITNSEFSENDVLALDGCPLAGDYLDSVFMSQRLNQYFGASTKYRLPMSSNVLSMPQAVIERLNNPAHIVHLKEKETYNFIKEIQKCALKKEDQLAIERLFTLIEDQQIFSFFETIENTKKQLSKKSKDLFQFNYPDLIISEIFASSDFETWSSTIKNEIQKTIDRCLEQAQINSDQIDSIFLTGGTAHVPFIQNMFKDRFGNDKIQTKKHFHSVLSGLVQQASLI